MKEEGKYWSVRANRAKSTSVNDEHVDRFCALSEPYPEVRVEGPNPFYARLLLEDFAGVVSENTAINQYLYHHLTLKDYPDVAELEECIAIVEMHHYEILGELILLLGEEPRIGVLEDSTFRYWSGSYVYYGKGICDRLAADIAAEMAAIRNYTLHREMIHDRYVSEILTRIIQDEEYHLKLFREKLVKYCR